MTKSPKYISHKLWYVKILEKTCTTRPKHMKNPLTNIILTQNKTENIQ